VHYHWSLSSLYGHACTVTDHWAVCMVKRALSLITEQFVWSRARWLATYVCFVGRRRRSSDNYRRHMAAGRAGVFARSIFPSRSASRWRLEACRAWWERAPTARSARARPVIACGVTACRSSVRLFVVVCPGGQRTTFCRRGWSPVDQRGTICAQCALISRVKWTAQRCVGALLSALCCTEYNCNEKALRETQTLRAGCSKAEPKIFAPPQTPFLGAQDGQNLISWRWSLPLPTNPVWWGSMHAISSYRGNRHTHTHTHTNKQTNSKTGPITIHCAAKLSAQCNQSTVTFALLLQLHLHHVTATYPDRKMTDGRITSHNCVLVGASATGG